MPNPLLKRITLPSGSVYNITDEAAWQAIQELQEMIAGVMHFRGRTLTEIYDGATTSPIILADDPENPYTPQSGDVVTYTPQGSEHELEFAWTGHQWQEYGSSGALKALAFKDTASGTVSVPQTATFTGSNLQSTGSYTPEGSVSTPTISLTTGGATDTIHNPTAKTVVEQVDVEDPGVVSGALQYWSVQNETLILKNIVPTSGASITTSDVTVKTGDGAYESSQPMFTGTQDTIEVSGTPSGTITFTNADETVTVS